jgi:hypothetical protein
MLEDLMFKEFVRDPSGQALVSDQAPAGLDAPRFDPSRVYDDFRSWVGEQNPGLEYQYFDHGGCAFALFLKIKGIAQDPWVGGATWIDDGGQRYDFPRSVHIPLAQAGWTFGALADRLAKAV